jgi:hypothetical protein
MSLEDSSLTRLIRWAVRFERANEAIKHEELQWEPSFKTQSQESQDVESRASEKPNKPGNGRASVGAMRLSHDSDNEYSSDEMVLAKWPEESGSESVSEDEERDSADFESTAEDYLEETESEASSLEEDE